MATKISFIELLSESRKVLLIIAKELSVFFVNIHYLLFKAIDAILLSKF